MHPTTRLRASAPPSAPGNGLELLWLELTPKCNLRCVHCYAESGPEKPLNQGMGLGQWKRTLEEAAELGCRRGQFIGGEPTVHPGLPELIAHSRRLGFDTIEVYTNGTLFTPSLKRVFSEHRVALAFSVYADEARVHDGVTGKTGSFERALDSLRWAVASRLPVRAGIVEMDGNRGRVEATRKMLRQAGAGSIRVDRLRQVGRGLRGEETRSPLAELCGRCCQGRLCVTATGGIFPCVFSRAFPVGRFSEGLAAVARGPRLGEFREALKAHTRGRPGLQDAPCDPDLPAPPCDPDMPSPPCDPDMPG